MDNWDLDSRLWVPAVLLLILAVALIVVWIVRRRRPTPYGGGPTPLAYGLDFSWGRPPVDAIVEGGYEFVCRYLSWSTSGKNLTPDEAADYRAAGIAIVSNWEYYADGAKGGYPQGVADAEEAARQHEWCGGGDGDPIYFSVDWDCQEWEYPMVADYFRGVASVIGWGRVGAYGGYNPIRWLFNDKLIVYGWQTYAWSYGNWDTRAQLRQVQNGVDLAGHDVDINEAWASDYGAWGQGQTSPYEGGGVLITCPTEPDRLDLFYVAPDGAVWHRWCKGDMNALWTGKGVSKESLGGRLVAGTVSACWAPDGTAINVTGLGAADEAGVPVGAGQYWGQVIYRSGSKSGWGSLAGVYGAYPVTAN